MYNITWHTVCPESLQMISAGSLDWDFMLLESRWKEGVPATTSCSGEIWIQSPHFPSQELKPQICCSAAELGVPVNFWPQFSGSLAFFRGDPPFRGAFCCSGGIIVIHSGDLNHLGPFGNTFLFQPFFCKDFFFNYLINWFFWVL